MKVRTVAIGDRMVSEKTKNALKGLNLTEYGTRAYIALVSAGPSTAGDLSETSDVPQSRIYDVLSKLEKKGWVESQSGRPALYRAKPPSEALRLVKIRQREEIKSAAEVIEQELEPLYEEREEVEMPEIWTLRGNRQILGKIEEMLSEAEIEVLISIPVMPDEFSDILDFIPVLETKNLDLRLLTSEESNLLEDMKSEAGLEVRFRETLFGGGVIVDGKEVLLVLESGGRRLGIWSGEVGLTKFAKEYFEYLWEDARKSPPRSTSGEISK